MAAAVPRSLVGNHAAAILLLPGKAGDSDKPTKNLSTKSEVMMVAVSPKMSVKPIQTVNKDHKNRLQKYTRRAPNLSSSQPPGI